MTPNREKVKAKKILLKIYEKQKLLNLWVTESFPTREGGAISLIFGGKTPLPVLGRGRGRGPGKCTKAS